MHLIGCQHLQIILIVTYICKPHVFKVVLSLVLLNCLRLLKSRGKIFGGLSIIGGTKRFDRV